MEVVFGPQIMLPTKHGEFDVTYVEVISDEIHREGVLLYKSPVDENFIYVRVQSSCLFSESFWTTDCDCALQLQNSMRLISEHGGAVLYFYEEGRGAGLNTKFRAIQLQQARKIDTKAAYECMGINTDSRNFEAAAHVLRKKFLDAPIIVLTNNQDKVKGLMDYGVVVKERKEWIFGNEDPLIRNYLKEKKNTLGHLIPKTYVE
jgi:GTP cyclohydrolase II